VTLGRGTRAERSEVAAPAGPRILLARVEAVFARGQLSNHLNDRRNRSGALAQHDVHRSLACDVLRAFVPQRTQIDAAQQTLADGAEHVAPENPRADSVEASFGDVVVDARLAASLPCIRRQMRVWRNQSINSGPPTPSGLCRSWLGPAP